MFEFRKIQENEFDQFFLLFNQYLEFYNVNRSSHDVKLFLKERMAGDSEVIVIECIPENKIIGFAQIYMSYSSLNLSEMWVLNDLYINQRYRQMGLGNQIIDYIKELAIDSNIRTIVLETQSSNYVAMGLYFKQGFQLDNSLITFKWTHK